ncbi:hypothetical protein WME75_00750 [Sorangium sp. So ce1014]|uniref:hypothetical protein n=1 Tax=Sorangium sp. So ce1014 TaxID=3133326 RepID=UPI003F633485
MMRRPLELILCLSMGTALGACGDDASGGEATTHSGGAGATSASGAGGAGAGPGGAGPGSGGAGAGSPAHEGGGPPAGNPDGSCAVPAEARAADTSSPTTVIGDGTPASCTSEAVVRAVAAGGIITFDCGPDPITITLEETAKIFNDTGPEIVIDGGGLVTLSGGGQRRILYMNTCDEAQVWTTSSCDNQDHPRLTIQNLTFIEGDSTGDDDEGGGAIFAQGGRLKVVNSRFFNNACDAVGPDVGGAGIRAFMQYNGLPLYVVNSTFGGAEGHGNACANGGGISSIGVSWTVVNSLFSHNRALGNGGNPAEEGTPGGGSGGAIYNDGNAMTLTLCGTRIERNEVNAHGSAIFFVSNDHTGNIVIDRSVITENIGGSWYPTYPQISNHDDTPIAVTDSVIE